MNQRILELAKQAGLKGFSEEDLSLQEKVFVQLMVKECCSVLQTEELRHSGYGYNQFFLHKKIKEHFGVKE